jgi:hypothetical protein
MSTMTSVHAPVKPGGKPRLFACSGPHPDPDGTGRFVTINGTHYDLRPIPPGECGTAAFVLEKHADPDATYSVIRTHAGLVECSCPDYEARHRGIDCGYCKHGRALVELGLLRAAKPEPIASARLTAPDAPQSVAGAGTPEATVETPAACCDASEAAPCQSCATPQEPAGFADELAAAVGPIAPTGEPTAQDLAEMYRFRAEAEARELGLIPHEADPADWPSWTDEEVWELDDEPADLLTLDELIDHEAGRYRRIGTLAGEMIGRHLAELASMVRFVRASDPETAADRIATLERDRLRGD